jgi:uroporphyrinogen decarboxylase
VRSTGCGVRLGPLSGDLASQDDHLERYALPGSPVREALSAKEVQAVEAPPAAHPVRNADDWRKIKPSYQFHPDRTDWARVAAAKKARVKGTLVTARIPGAFETACRLMGEDDARIAFHDQPELMVDIVDTLTNAAMRVYQRLADKLVPDVLYVRENLAEVAGPLLAPERVREYIAPYYRTLWCMLSSRGTRLFQFESRGNIAPLMEVLVDAGVNAFCPMEVAAGMDIVAARRDYGTRVAVIGGIDKEVLRRGKSAIRKELEHRMQPMMREGGAVFALDNDVPKGTSLESYLYYVRLGRELLGLSPHGPRKAAWQR